MRQHDSSVECVNMKCMQAEWKPLKTDRKSKYVEKAGKRA